jgi:hypothetical protein
MLWFSRPSISCACGLLVLVTSRSARADGESPEEGPAQLRAYRPTYELGYQAGFVSAVSNPASYQPAGAIGIIGLSFRAGLVDASSIFGFGAEASASFFAVPAAAVSVYGRGAAQVILTPRDWFSVGMGPVFGGGLSGSRTGVGTFTYGGVTGRMDFRFFRTNAGNGRGRTALTLGLAADVGGLFSSYASAGPVVGTFLNVGYAFSY